LLQQGAGFKLAFILGFIDTPVSADGFFRQSVIFTGLALAVFKQIVDDLFDALILYHSTSLIIEKARTRRARYRKTPKG